MPAISNSNSHGENNENRNRHGGGGNHLLHQPSDGLNHAQAVGGLHPRPLQPVVENRIFVSNKIQFRRVLHHPNADVAGIFVRQQSIEIVNCPGENAAEDGDGELRRNQPPEERLHVLMIGNGINDAVDDEFGDPQRREGHERADQPKHQSQGHDKRA